MQSDDELIESSSVSVSGMHETLSLSMQDQPLHHPGIPTDASDQDCATRMPNKFTVMPSSPMLQGPLRDPEKDSLLTVVKDKTPNYLSQPALALGPELQLLRRERQFVFSDAHTDSQSNIRNDDLSSLLALIPSFPTYAPQLALLDEEYTARNLNMDWTEE